jgi:hypothetical protein
VIVADGEVDTVYMIIMKRSLDPVTNQISGKGKSSPARECEKQLHEYLGNRLRHSDYESGWTEMIVTAGDKLMPVLYHDGSK